MSDDRITVTATGPWSYAAVWVYGTIMAYGVLSLSRDIMEMFFR